MKKFFGVLIVCVAVAVLSGASALAYPTLSGGQLITKHDGYSVSSSPWQANGGQEDQEVEHSNTIATQIWDFEAMYLVRDTTTNPFEPIIRLTIIAGFDLDAGGVNSGPNHVYLGDLWGINSKNGGTVDGWVIDFDQYSNSTGHGLSDHSFSAYIGTTLNYTSVNRNELKPYSDPLLYSGNGINAGGGNYSTDSTLDNIYVSGNPDPIATGGKHWIMTLTLPSGYDVDDSAWGGIELHLTMECGNDVIKGQKVPEPATMLLLGMGLFGLTFASRKKLVK